MITFIEYWRESVRDKMLAVAGASISPDHVRDQLVASGKAIDTLLAKVVEYAEGHEERSENGKTMHQVINQVRVLNTWLGTSLFGGREIWDPDARISAQSLFHELNRACNCCLSMNWWPAAATIRYAEPAHTHAEIVGCAPWFKDELFYEGIEYDQHLQPIGDSRHQILISACGYLDPTSVPPDLIVTELVCFSDVETGRCQAVEFIHSSDRIMGMSPESAWVRELDKIKKRSKKSLASKITEARAHLLMDKGVVH
jgi:hypothetical protein